MIIETTQNKKFIIDDEDYERVSQFKWHAAKNNICAFYIKRWDGLMLHNFIMGLDKNGYTVDHINHDGLDNRKCNLRRCTRRQNLANRRIKNNTGHKGVDYIKNRKKFRMCIRVEYDTAEEAGDAYMKCAKLLFGEFACK